LIAFRDVEETGGEISPFARYRFGELEIFAEDPAEALHQSALLLKRDADNLFGLGLRARAAGALGATTLETQAYRRFLHVYEEETASDKRDYQDHEEELEALRLRAVEHIAESEEDT
jgi:hypothetical protein